MTRQEAHRLFERLRAQFAAHRPELRTLRLVLRKRHFLRHPAPRDLAWYETDDGTVNLMEAALAGPAGRVEGLLAHELGHALDEDATRPYAERRADALAKRVLGVPVRYDDGDVQNLHRGVTPRPARLHENRESEMKRNPAKDNLLTTSYVPYFAQQYREKAKSKLQDIFRGKGGSGYAMRDQSSMIIVVNTFDLTEVVTLDCSIGFYVSTDRGQNWTQYPTLGEAIKAAKNAILKHTAKRRSINLVRNPNEYAKAQYPYEVYYQKMAKGKVHTGSVPVATMAEAKECVQGMKRSPQVIEAFVRKRNPKKGYRMPETQARHTAEGLLARMKADGADTFAKKVAWVKKHMPSIDRPRTFVGWVTKGERGRVVYKKRNPLAGPYPEKVDWDDADSFEAHIVLDDGQVVAAGKLKHSTVDSALAAVNGLLKFGGQISLYRVKMIEILAYRGNDYLGSQRWVQEGSKRNPSLPVLDAGKEIPNLTALYRRDKSWLRTVTKDRVRHMRNGLGGTLDYATKYAAAFALTSHQPAYVYQTSRGARAPSWLATTDAATALAKVSGEHVRVSDEVRIVYPDLTVKDHRIVSRNPRRRFAR